MKTYVLTISTTFPTTHLKAGQPTYFKEKISTQEKKHTIRMNYDLWKKRVEDINAGKAILSIRKWSGKPYRSPQIELFTYTKVGIQKVEMTVFGWFIDDVESEVSTRQLACNDGLSVEDFSDWFKRMRMGKEMAIIHFTDFRYDIVSLSSENQDNKPVKIM